MECKNPTFVRVSIAMIRLSFLTLLALAVSSAIAVEPPLSDDFSDPNLKARRASRGAWVMEGGIAKVTQDDELYKKFKDHGPIIFYDIDHKDAVIEFSYKAEDAKSVVFTVNGADGHVFRTVTSAAGTSFRAFPPSDDHASIALHQLKQPLAQGEWTHMKIELKGPKATVTLGNNEPITVEHPSLDRAKVNTSIGFSFGTLSVKGFSIQ